MIQELKKVKSASRQLASLSGEIRSRALTLFATQILSNCAKLLAANAEDRTGAQATATPSEFARLELTPARLHAIADGILQLSETPDPIGAILATTVLDDGLVLKKVSVPIGTVGVIFEARPDVLPQLAALCLRSGNGIVLKGGSETRATNRAWIDLLDSVQKDVPQLPVPWILNLEGRENVPCMLEANDALDLIIPRGSKALVEEILAKSRVPVLGHAEGICHLFVDASANLTSALEILIDSKLQYPAACNSVETLLLHSSVASPFIADLVSTAKSRSLFLRGCSRTRALSESIEPVADGAWSKEYGGPILAIKIVDSLDEAIEHINTFGSHHTDCIISEDSHSQEEFETRIDSSSVMVNCSTRFADGSRYGFGAEVGISTGKIHARGPVGIDGLLTYQYRLHGTGQVVASYCGEDAKKFKHART